MSMKVYLAVLLPLMVFGIGMAIAYAQQEIEEEDKLHGCHYPSWKCHPEDLRETWKQKCNSKSFAEDNSVCRHFTN